MDEIIVQVVLRCFHKDEDRDERLGSVFNQLSNFATSFFAQLDVVSDFYFWESVKTRDENFDGKHDITRAILAFAILGLLLLVVQGLEKIVWMLKGRSSGDGEHGRRLHNWSFYDLFIIPLEDLPQLLLLLIVCQKTTFTNVALFSFWSGFTSSCMKLYMIIDWRGRGRGHENRPSIFIGGISELNEVLFVSL